MPNNTFFVEALSIITNNSYNLMIPCICKSYNPGLNSMKIILVIPFSLQYIQPKLEMKLFRINNPINIRENFCS